MLHTVIIPVTDEILLIKYNTPFKTPDGICVT